MSIVPPKSQKLIHFIRRLVGYDIEVELKDGSKVSGKCTGIDHSSNLHLKNAKYYKFEDIYDPTRNFFVTNFEFATIRGNQVLYICFPDDVDISKFLEINPRSRYNPPTFKAKDIYISDGDIELPDVIF